MNKIIVNSTVPRCVVSNYDTSQLDYCNIVYMCIKNISCSEYQIPYNLEPFVNQVISDIYRLSANLYDDDWTKYCYLTIKRYYIQPNSLGNREGWHIDGFKSDQENFLWSDCDATPTEVALGGFELTNDHNASLGEMNTQASKMFQHQLDSFRLYEMDKDCVHRPTYNNTDKAVLRTFVKVTYSKELFNCFGNAWNYKLPNIKPTSFRNEIRNHSKL